MPDLPRRTPKDSPNLSVHSTEDGSTLKAGAVAVPYSNNSKSYRVYNPATRRTMESKNVIFIETPSRLLSPQSEERLMQSRGLGQAGEDRPQLHYHRLPFFV